MDTSGPTSERPGWALRPNVPFTTYFFAAATWAIRPFFLPYEGARYKKEVLKGIFASIERLMTYGLMVLVANKVSTFIFETGWSQFLASAVFIFVLWRYFLWAFMGLMFPIGYFREWFAVNPGWMELDFKITEALINRFYPNPMFEVFIYLSWENNLVREYKNLGRYLEISPEAFYGQVNLILSRLGDSHVKQITQVIDQVKRTGKRDELKETWLKSSQIIKDSFECCLAIQPSYAYACLQLTNYYGIIQDFNEAKKWCSKGLGEVVKQKNLMIDGPVRNSKYADQFNLSLQQLEDALLMMHYKLQRI